ncbi:FAD dependent oxidoreductase-domain-containing protein [Corynascus novoguineensis]|uniref:FAD dependent oxidoreductase-domain-containing protein n=1 Tax=Corynascus novoguineensis TaxID=1126955 RepID=A0AAN7CR73_9PEZI|nr:FAD dependent oxidoreductase-domain-containing protein [Corynascus novoguineensis]
MTASSTKTNLPDPERFMHTSGATDAVWVHKQPFSALPRFSALDRDLTADVDVVVIGAGIAGIHVAYELVQRGRRVVLLEARDVLSGESGRTSGHLTNDLDDGYLEIAKKHDEGGARVAAESHAWARDRIGEIARELGIECEYRKLPAYDISQYAVGSEGNKEELQELKEEAKFQRCLGIESRFNENLTVRGWTGKPDQRGGIVVENQATFHPTRYLAGVLEWLKQQPNFQCYTRTRVVGIHEKGVEMLGMGHKSVTIDTEAGHTVKAEYAVEATCIPLQKLSVVAELEYYRSYCIAVRVPKGSVEDCLLYDNAEEYKYVRLTACDDKDDYLVVGGCDHKVGQEETTPRFDELEKWTRERFTQAGKTDYRWSGQIFEPIDYMAFIGKNQGNDKIFIVTGDSGDGLTHGVLAGRLIADEIEGKANIWASLYDPKRLGSIIKTLPSMVKHDIQINTQYKRFLQTDITDIEELGKGCGGVLNSSTSQPLAVYKDEEGKTHKYSALCPHMKGVVCWNHVEKSFDCPVHGSRFSKDGICITGPAKANLSPADKAGAADQEDAAGAGM